MKRLVVFVFLLFGTFLWSEDISLKVLSTFSSVFPRHWTSGGVAIGNSFVAANSARSPIFTLIVIDWKTGQVEIGRDETYGIMGIWKGKVLMLMEDESGDYNALYDPTNKTFERISFANREGPIGGLMEYQNGLGLAAYLPRVVTEGMQPGAGLFNSSTGVTEKLILMDKSHPDEYSREVDNEAEPKAFSMDKVHALYVFGPSFPSYRMFAIVDLTSRAIATAYQENFRHNESMHAQFLTNALFIQGRSDTDLSWTLRDLTGKVIGKLDFPILPDGGKVLWIQFSPDLTRAIVLSDKQTGTMYSDVYFVDSSALVTYLDKLGLLFHPTTGTLNDSKVRMRENPNLDAKVLSIYSKGETFDVTDRSGLQVKIGSVNAYWYKVRSKDGTEGWIYGGYIDLANDAKQ